MSIFIATPTYDARVNASYMLGVVGSLVSYSEKFGLRMGMTHGTLIDRARDELAEQALQSGSDLFFIDSDIGFAPRTLHDLIEKADESEVPILAGAYPRRTGVDGHDNLFSVRVFPGPVRRGKGGVVEVECAPTGFMLIRHRVLASLAEKAPRYRVENGLIHRFFTFILEGDNLLGEDFAFCRSAREAGFPTFVMPGLHLAHEGAKSYTGAWTPQAKNVI